MNSTREKKLEIMLTEYRTLKEEQKYIFSFQFSIIGIWIAFLGVIIGFLFTQINNIETYAYASTTPYELMDTLSVMPQSRKVIALLTTILIPGVCSLFSLIWLDLTTRFIKEGHYIYMLEENIQKLYPKTLNFEHFLYNETKNDKGWKRTNYLYYYIMLGISIMCPVLVSLFLYYFHKIMDLANIHIAIFIFIEVFTLIFSRQYIKRIRSYEKLKSSTTK